MMMLRTKNDGTDIARRKMKNTLTAVRDIDKALIFFGDMFGLELVTTPTAIR